MGKTKEQNTQAELQKLQAELDQLKSDFREYSRIVSHDLSAPFRQIRSFVDLIEKLSADEMSEESLGYLEHIEQAATKGQKTIEGMLEYYRIPVQMEAFEQTPFKACLHSATKRLQKKYTHDVEIVAGELPELSCDAHMMERVFYRILDNAILYQPEGQTPHITIAASVDQSWANIVIKDNGIGMESDKAPQCFKVLTRLNHDIRYEGTGMGLAIAARIVEQHGGKLHVVSSPNEGSSFTISLPVA